jgi:hypothetical protein
VSEHLTDGWEPGLPVVGAVGDMSRPGAEALGFLPVTRFTLWHRPRATSLLREGSGLKAGGELWSWGRRCCSM